MLSRIGNRKKIILSTLLMVLLIWGVQGVSYGQELSVSLSGPSSTVELGTDFNLETTITNTGTNLSTPTVLSVYRSTGPNFVTEDPIRSTTVGAIPGNGASTSLTFRLTAPNTAAIYRYRVNLTVMSGDTGVNNSASVEVTVGQSLSNLTISRTLSANPSYAVTPGGYITLTTYVSNTGAASPSTTFNVYRSNTGAAADFGTNVLSFTANILANANQQTVSSSQVRVPTFPGTYYYRVQIGADRTNSSNYIPVIVTNPVDLGVDPPFVDKATVAPGETFTLSTVVRNVGAGNFTGTTTLRYFQSADTTLNRIDGSDTEVGTDTISSTLSGSYGTTSENITLRAPSESGTYYYFAYIEPVLGEGNYYRNIANNTSAYVMVTVSAPPDLTVDLYRVRQATFAPGERFTLEVTISNIGTGASAATQLRVYEDSDDRYRRELEIARRSVNAISAGRSSAERILLEAPTEAGSYYYRVSVEPVAGETETDNNSSTWMGIDVLEPLVLESLRPSKVALASGERFTLTATVKNDGDARSDATTVRYYRSSDNSLSSRDTLLGNRTVSRLAAGATTQVSIPLTAPQLPGTYYYGACVGDSQTYSGDACEVIKLNVLVVSVILPESQRPPMDWVDADSGTLQSLTGSEVDPFVASVRNATAIAIDMAGGKVYWAEQIAKE